MPSALKSSLLDAASLLIYTPSFEHFGIVPLEAMLARVPVLAANTGGPTETIVDGETGWLRSAEAVEEWTEVVRFALGEGKEKELECMGEAGRKRVTEQFSKEKMAERLEEEIRAMMGRERRRDVLNYAAVVALPVVGMVVVMLSAYAVVYLRRRLKSLD